MADRPSGAGRPGKSLDKDGFAGIPPFWLKVYLAGPSTFSVRQAPLQASRACVVALAAACSRDLTYCSSRSELSQTVRR